MMRSKTSRDIHAALKKLKDQSNEKEIELIELISSIYETVKDQQNKAMDKIEDTATAVNNSVHLHPWHYIGGAALCGLVAGFILRR